MGISTLSILQTAEISSEDALGNRRIRNRPQLLGKLRVHKRVVGICILALYLSILLIIVASIVLAVRQPEQITQGFLPYLGGVIFIGLLEFARRLLKEYSLVTLPLTVAEHVGDDELAGFIQSLLVLRLEGTSRETIVPTGTTPG